MPKKVSQRRIVPLLVATGLVVGGIYLLQPQTSYSSESTEGTRIQEPGTSGEGGKSGQQTESSEQSVVSSQLSVISHKLSTSQQTTPTKAPSLLPKVLQSGQVAETEEPARIVSQSITPSFTPTLPASVDTPTSVPTLKPTASPTIKVTQVPITPTPALVTLKIEGIAQPKAFTAALAASSVGLLTQQTMAQNGLSFDYEVSELGWFVTELAGVKQNPLTSHYWTFYVNGVLGQKSGDKTSVKAGDIIRWVYSAAF